MGVFNGSETLEKYEAILKSSIDHFNDPFGRRESDFSALGAVFASMIETMEDPPLEFIWFYSALAFRCSRLTHQEPSRKFLIIKDSFDSVQWYSKSCNGLSKISALAPIMYILCSYSKGHLCLMGEEIEGFVKGIVGYISICCVNDLRQKEIALGSDMVVDFLDLIRVWTADKVGESCELVDAIRLFFPLLSDEIRRRVVVGCGMRFLAGVVMAEFLLWWLCLRVSGNELRSDMQTLMARIVKEFQNSYFHDMLLRMMLEPSLPVTTLVSSGEEVFLRKVLYDAVILGDFPFLKCARSTQLPENHLKNLYLAWLLVVDNAIKFEREYGEPAAATFFIDAYSKSDIPNLLIQWVSTQTGMEEKLSRPDMPTPKALIKWLLLLEDQGIRVFDEDFFKSHAKAAICKSRVDYARPGLMPAGDTTFSDIGIHEEQKKDKSTVTHGRRKREEEMNEEAKRTKIAECDFQECHPFTENYLPLDALIRDDGDEDMEDLG